MNKESKDFLFSLLTTPSVSGFEQRIQRLVRTRMNRYADSIETDLNGNLVVAINKSAKRRVILAGHCDQIGFMVKHISATGYLYLSPVGGIDVGVLQGSHVTIHSSKAGEIPGVFGRKPAHLQTPEERAKVKLDLEDLWVDIGAKDKKEAEKLIELGDSVSFRLGVTELRNNLICSPGIDNAAGLFVVMEALRICAESKVSVALFAVSTVEEEMGMRGVRTAAFEIEPEVGIAVDVSHGSDNPGNDGPKNIPCKLGSGPGVRRGINTNPVVESMIRAAAKKSKLPIQLMPSNVPLSNDANAIQISRGGVATGTVVIPNRYMHTPIEICSLTDLENAAKLIAAFVKSISVKSDFRPR